MDFSNLFCSTLSSSSIPSNFGVPYLDSDLKFCFQQSLSQTPSFEEVNNLLLLLLFWMNENFLTPTKVVHTLANTLDLNAKQARNGHSQPKTTTRKKATEERRRQLYKTPSGCTTRQNADKKTSAKSNIQKPNHNEQRSRNSPNN